VLKHRWSHRYLRAWQGLQLAQYLKSLRLKHELAILDQLENGGGSNETGQLACPEESIGLYWYLVVEICVVAKSLEAAHRSRHDGGSGVIGIRQRPATSARVPRGLRTALRIGSESGLAPSPGNG
jgi:hypothetical protein